jgi:hypothetical protein
MTILAERLIKAVVIWPVADAPKLWRLSIVLFIMGGAGCATKTEILPPTNVGVLSAMHQRALNAATTRAIEQAGIDESFLGPEKVYLDVKAVGAADLGKQHVSGAVLSELDTLGAVVVDDPSAADSTVSCLIHVAGTDPDKGEFLFWKWKEVKADVELSFAKTIGQKVIKKRGVGTATYNETWFLGFGPETKIK